MSHRSRQFLVLLATLATLVVNGLANALPINGLTTGEISDSFDALFVPAGYVFSIWGVIYLGLIGYAIFQALPSQRENPRLNASAGPFLLASAANIAWIFLWHYQIFALTILVMLLLLGSLIAIYRRQRSTEGEVSSGERWLVRLPFSIYLAWVSVATIANAADVLTYFGWNNFGLPEAAWAIIMLGVGLLLSGSMTWRERDVAYDLVFIWAYVGIGVAQAEASQAVSVAAYLAAAILAVFASIAFLRRDRTGRRAATAS